MAKQKSGLHKQVSSIFGDHGELQRQNDHDQTAQQVAVENEPKKNSFPGNLSPKANDIQPNKKQEVEKNTDFPKIEPTEPKQPNQLPQTTEKPKDAKKVMLPASLSKPAKMNLVDNLKLKIHLYVEENGTRQLYSLIAIPLLAIILIFFMWKNIFPSRPAANSKNTSTKQVNEAPQNVIAEKLAWEKPSFFPAQMRDPMRQATTGTNQNAKFQIKGIVYMEEAPSESAALIGNMTVYIGDQVDGATVKDIQRNYVIFNLNGQTIKQGVGSN